MKNFPHNLFLLTFNYDVPSRQPIYKGVVLAENEKWAINESIVWYMIYEAAVAVRTFENIARFV